MEQTQQSQMQMTTACRIKHGTENQYKCRVCCDTGWVLMRQNIEDYGDNILFARACDKCKIQRRLADTTGIPSEYCDADLSKFKWDLYGVDMTQMRRICEDFVQHYQDRWVKANKGLYLWSKVPGSGKTFLSSCLAQSVAIKYDLQMRFVTAADYLAAVGASYKYDVIDSSAVYRSCSLLVLDDIGSQKQGDWQNQELYRLINARLQDGLITIYTSNYPIDQLNVDERIKSRILRQSIVLQMPEKSIRNQQAQEQQSKFLADIIGGKK